MRRRDPPLPSPSRGRLRRVARGEAEGRGRGGGGGEGAEGGKRGADAEKATDLHGDDAGGKTGRGQPSGHPKRLPSRLLNESVPLRPPVLLAGRVADAVDTRAYPAQTERNSTRVPRGRIATNMLQIRDGGS